MSSYGFFTDIVVFLFFAFIAVVVIGVGGIIGFALLKGGETIIGRLFGVGILGGTVLIGLFFVIGAVLSFSDDSQKGDSDIEVYSTLQYDREVMVKDTHTTKSASDRRYLYYLDDGTEIGLTKRLHKYVQDYPSDSTFRIIYADDPYPREYDYETHFFGSDTPGTPLIEADYVEIQ